MTTERYTYVVRKVSPHGAWDDQWWAHSVNGWSDVRGKAFEWEDGGDAHDAARALQQLINAEGQPSDPYKVRVYRRRSR